VDFFTLSGERVREVQEIGGMAYWDGRNEARLFVSPGVYFYVIQANGQVLEEGKIIVSVNH
jgi:hypothetical protein